MGAAFLADEKVIIEQSVTSDVVIRALAAAQKRDDSYTVTKQKCVAMGAMYSS